MSTIKKKIEELEAPQLPGTINNNAVLSAAQGVQNARNAVANMTYDNFKRGSAYSDLQKSYTQQGQQAMKDTLGQVAARTGGMASSYATSAANQSYNNYMKALEDAARSMYNDEYSRARDKVDMAQSEYNNAYNEYRDRVGDAWAIYDAEATAYKDARDYNYKVERDAAADSEDEKLQAQEDVKAIWQSGGTPSKDLLVAAGWADATAPEGSLNVAGAAYKSQVDKATKEQEQADIYDEIAAMIDNGGTLEEIETIYAQGGKMDWKGLTGISKAEWQQIYNENETKGYTYPKTAEGANNIVANLTNSASLSLSDKDQKNFDYIFGSGAYEAMQNFIESIGQVQASPGDEAKIEEWYDAEIDKLQAKIPSLTGEQIDMLLSSANPMATNVYYDPDYFRQ